MLAVQAYREFLERVRGATDIVRLVGEYVPLRKAGRRHVGLCPFHPEKTPSFSVDEEKQLFYCFGCHTGGDAFKFLMLYEKVEFQEAARTLGEKAGVEPPRASTEAGGKGWGGAGDPIREPLLEVHRRAADFFVRSLRGPEGAVARDYLRRRGMSENTVEALGIGYAPGSWDALKSHLLAGRLPAQLLAKSGLFSSREGSSGSYDRFRDRLMFPIYAPSGRVIAFGGRVIADGERASAPAPKYVNSPETPIYSKGETLYGLNWSREEIRKKGKAVVVEGYMDFAALFEAGVRHCVATLGTAFTPGQARLLARHTDRLTVNYDPDPAGIAAARRSLDLLLSRGFSVQVLRLEHGLDPDAFVRERGAEDYRAALEAAPGCVDFLLAEAVRGKDMGDPAAQAEALNEILPHVANLDNIAERSGWYGRIAEVLGLEDEVVLAQMKKALRAGARSVVPSRATETGKTGGGSSQITETESRLVRSLMESPEARREVLSALASEDIEGLAAAPILEVLREMEASGEEPRVQALMNRLPLGEPRDLLAQITFQPAGEHTADEAGKCLASLRRERMIAERRRLQKEIDSAGAAVPEMLLRRKIELVRRINELS